MSDTLLDWWSLTTAKVGVPAVLLLLVYLGLCAWLFYDIAANLWRIWSTRTIRRRLREVHEQAYRERVVSIADRAARRRAEMGGPDAA